MILGFYADEVFLIAIEIEKNGIAFYGRAKKALKNDNIKELFSRLENEEEKHLHNLQKMRAELPGSAKRKTDYHISSDVQTKADEEITNYVRDIADMNVFRKPQNVKNYINGIKTVEDALRMAIQFEKDSISFYLILRDLMEKDKEKGFVDDIISEEKEHLKDLAKELRNEVGRRNLNVFQLPVCAGQTAMDAEQARAGNLDEPCDDFRGGV